MDSGGTWRLGHRPALDGLRAIAVIPVIAVHTGLIRGGDVGVDLFFTLSGFLITTLLLTEHEGSGAIQLRRFYLRRSLRLIPALVVVVTAVAAFGLIMRPGAWWAEPVDAAAALTYTTNFLLASGEPSALLHTWSLAMEEQFYLTWPLILLVVAPYGRRAVMLFALGGAAGSTLWAWSISDTASPLRLDFAPDTRLAPILIGCALAAWLQGRAAVAPPACVAWAALLAVGWLAVMGGGGTFRPAMTGALSAALLLVAVRPTGFRTFELRPLMWLGRRSYGIYLWHYPVSLVFSAELPSGVRFALVTLVTVGFAALSFRFIEAPFLRLKEGVLGGTEEVAGKDPGDVQGTAAALRGDDFHVVAGSEVQSRSRALER